jgi:superfamily I DNA/RNA helicase
MDNTAKTWSDEQTGIFNWFESGQGNLVVRARAGTGKTTTIIEGVNRAPERAILLAAFNKSIATELQRRIKNPKVEAKTLHALGFKFVLRNWNGVKLDENNERAKGLAARSAPDDAPSPMLKLIADLHTKAREIEPFIVLKGRPSDLIDLAVQFNLVPDEEWEAQKWNLDRICECAFNAMKLAMERTPIIDFADMIFLPLVNKWVKPWYQMVVVDEAQDMTKAQLALATQCCVRGGRICIVGDDRQAIYAFRGADSSSLDRLKKTLNAVELGLTTTYRCAKNIVNLAKALVPDFKHAPSAPDGVIATCDKDKLLSTAREGDFILSRTNAPLVRVCMALLKQGRRARIKGRDIGRGVIALIRKLGSDSILDLLSALTEHTERETARAMKLPEAAQEERLNFICDQAEIIRELSEGCLGVSDLIARCQDLFADDAEKQSIMCSTVHRAKGLEADNTFLLEGTFRKGRQEEDNIRYVAITRAKTRMTWVSGYGKAEVAAAAPRV